MIARAARTVVHRATTVNSLPPTSGGSVLMMMGFIVTRGIKHTGSFGIKYTVLIVLIVHGIWILG